MKKNMMDIINEANELRASGVDPDTISEMLKLAMAEYKTAAEPPKAEPPKAEQPPKDDNLGLSEGFKPFGAPAGDPEPVKSETETEPEPEPAKAETTSGGFKFRCSDRAVSRKAEDEQYAARRLLIQAALEKAADGKRWTLVVDPAFKAGVNEGKIAAVIVPLEVEPLARFGFDRGKKVPTLNFVGVRVGAHRNEKGELPFTYVNLPVAEVEQALSRSDTVYKEDCLVVEVNPKMEKDLKNGKSAFDEGYIQGFEIAKGARGTPFVFKKPPTDAAAAYSYGEPVQFA